MQISMIFIDYYIILVMFDMTNINSVTVHHQENGQNQR